MKKNSLNTQNQEDILAENLRQLCEKNKFVSGIVEIWGRYGQHINKLPEKIQHNREVFNSFNNLLNNRFTLFIDSDGDAGVTCIEDQYSDESLIAMCLGLLAQMDVNLDYLERYNSHFRGFSKFLSQQHPDLHHAYYSLSVKYGFDVYLDNNPLPSIIERIRNEEKADYFHRILLFIMKGLRCKIQDQDLNEVNAILNSFSRKVGKKCFFSVEDDGSLCFTMPDDPEFLKTTESAILVALGLFASFKINVEYLEKRNPRLNGLDAYLRQYQVYKAYSAVINKCGFDNTVRMDLNNPDFEYPNIQIERF